MALRKDIRIEKSYINANNDIEMYYSDNTHMKKLISATAGSYKQFPDVGVGIKNYLNASGKEKEISRKVIMTLQADGYTCDNPIIKVELGGKIFIDPNVTIKA
jgi:hypothetical protein